MLQRIKKGWIAAGLLVSLLLMPVIVLYSSNSARASEECQFFPETGFSACGRFLQYWRANGGLAQQGFPISDVFQEKNAAPPAGDGKVHRVQYFQRARFEEHLENQPPYDVLLGLLGAEQYQAKYSQNAPASVGDLPGGCQVFKETGFKVCGRFLEYWRANGGLMQQGFPISALFEEKNAAPPAGDGKVHRVQYFQRARFEEHTENQRPYDVLLGLLGTEQYRAKYSSGAPTYSFNGSGDQVTGKIFLPSGLARFSSSYTGSGNFVIQVVDSNGKTAGYGANVLDSYQGSRFVEVSGDGDYTLSVKAGGNWKIDVFDMNNLKAQPAEPKSNVYQGEGDKALKICVFKSGPTTIKSTYTGEHNFIVADYNRDGVLTNVWANEIGAYSGEKSGQMEAGSNYLRVESSGKWTIEIKQ